jgi:hypothetical protein
MGDREHALLSASFSPVWAICPPSARLVDQCIPKGVEAFSAIYSSEGTLLHEAAAYDLWHWAAGEGIEVITTSKKPKTRPRLSADLQEALECYVKLAKIAALDALFENPSSDVVIMLEAKIPYKAWAPDGFGTLDFAVVTKSVTTIVDLKGGLGLLVSPDSSQLVLYALGVLGLMMIERPELVSDEYVMVVSQPRRRELPRVFSATREQLLEIGEGLAHAADKAWRPLSEVSEDDYVPGPHCISCAAKGLCRARAKILLSAEESFKLKHLLSPEEVSRVLALRGPVTKWLNDVASLALSQVTKGAVIPGWKLSSSEGNRYIEERGPVEDLMRNLGFNDSEFLSLVGITKLEELLGKKRAKTVLGPYVKKLPGAIVLAPDNSPRPEPDDGDAAEGFNSEEQLP